MENLGDKIKEKRIQKNMTVEDLSKITFLSVAVIKDIEAGKFDQYDGDETYVKMYLKKISNALDMDSFELTQDYYALTKEIKLAQLKEKEELDKKQSEIVKKGKTFNFDSPQYTRKKSVYVDKTHIKVIRRIIVFCLIALLVLVIWMGISKTKSNISDPTFNPDNQTTIEGDVDTDLNTNDDNNQNSNNANQNVFNSDVNITRNDVLDFSISLPSDATKVTFKIIYGNDSWCSMKVNGKSYAGFDEKIYYSEDIVELTFDISQLQNIDLKNGYSMGHKYYINNVEIPLTEDDYIEGVTHLKLEFSKSNDIT